MLQFESGYAGDQSGVRFAARDGGRRVLFRVERQAVIGGLGLQPAGCEPLEALMQDTWKTCGEAAYVLTRMLPIMTISQSSRWKSVISDIVEMRRPSVSGRQGSYRPCKCSIGSPS